MNTAKRRVRRNAGDWLMLPELPREFMDKPDQWVQFARSALMPGYQARDPFKEAQMGTTVAEMQQQVPLTARGEHPDRDAPPLSARGTRPLSSWGAKFDPETADTGTLLQKLREYKPQIYVPPERGTKRELHQLLENMKEMALQAEFGVQSAEDSMTKVRPVVRSSSTQQQHAAAARSSTQQHAAARSSSSHRRCGVDS